MIISPKINSASISNNGCTIFFSWKLWDLFQSKKDFLVSQKLLTSLDVLLLKFFSSFKNLLQYRELFIFRYSIVPMRGRKMTWNDLQRPRLTLCPCRLIHVGVSLNPSSPSSSSSLFFFLNSSPSPPSVCGVRSVKRKNANLCVRIRRRKKK